jgi:NADH-quinone oxidoreductase subunit L
MTFASPHGSKILWLLAAITAVMTAFYMTRLFYLTFLGKNRYDEKHVHPHESPLTMTLPLMILAVLSVVGGFMGIPHASWLEHWLEPVIKGHGEGFLLYGHTTEYALMAFSTLGAVFGIWFAFRTYRSQGLAEARKNRHLKLYHKLENKWFVDEGYEKVFVKPIYQLSLTLWKKFDVAVIDRIVMGLGKLSLVTGEFFRVFQTGAVQSYAFTLFIGFLMTVGYLIYAVLK